MRAIRMTPIIAVAGIFIAAVCGPGGVKTAPTSTPVTADAFKGIATSVINDAMLRRVDFPYEWSSTPHDSTADGDVKLSPQCADLNTDGYAGSLVKANSPDFKGQREQSIMTDGAVYETADLAAAQVQKYVDEFTSCHDELVQAYHDASVRELAAQGVTDVQVTIESLTSPFAADWTWGYRVSFVFKSPRLQLAGKFDSYGMRYGRVVGSITYTDFGTIDQHTYDSVSGIFADRLRLANTKLPS